MSQGNSSDSLLRHMSHHSLIRQPDYIRDHAVVMMRFANDIMYAMSMVTKSLEVSLGPDTGDLDLRIGVRSICLFTPEMNSFQISHFYHGLLENRCTAAPLLLGFCVVSAPDFNFLGIP